jgi:uncharacterized protein YkwD
MTFKVMPALSAAILGLVTLGHAAEKATTSTAAPAKAAVKKEAKAATKPAPAKPAAKPEVKAVTKPAAPATAKPAAAAKAVKSGTTSKAKPAFTLISVEQKIVEKTNAERARHGLPPLTVDSSLMHSARSHTTWMTRSQQLQHTNAAVAENIAMGQTTSGEALQSWMSSPGHRANILNPRYRRIGVAAYRAANGATFWCQQFLW